MKKALDLFLTLFILLLSFALASCDIPSDAPSGEGDGEKSPESIIIPDAPSGIPAFKFSEITYSSPSLEDIELKYSAATEAVKNGDDFGECLEKIKLASNSASSFMTMYSYATVKMHINSADSYYVGEYERLAEWYPELIKLEEELYIAAAASKDYERYENECFGKGLTKKYGDGGIYSDEAVSLLEKEASLVSKYNSLSTASVIISYDGISDTFDNTVARLAERYGKSSDRYKTALKECRALYEQTTAKASREIFLALVKVRREIADELGYESYTDYAYELSGHDYQREEMEALINDISKYAVPVYKKLSYSTFKSTPALSVDTPTVVNDITRAIASSDKEIFDVYSHMLVSGLFNIEASEANRFRGSFTTYFIDFGAPYLFATVKGDISDYMTISHEFGHFYDYFMNRNKSSSLDLAEISSQALELIVLCNLKGELSHKEYSSLFRYEMKSSMEALIYQAFYAKFEHLVYDLKESEITPSRIDAAVVEAGKLMSLNTEHYSSFESIMITHLFTSPLYVQSYSTAALSSLEIFFAELEEEGEGVEIYRELVKRDGKLSYKEHLTSVGLSSPFEEGLVKSLSDKIHFTLIGSHFFEEYKRPATAFVKDGRFAA
ncbi:MAG: hypothetical protein J6Q85_06390 [Clostridia bacterium]|nr:hypothetical protein [Clostridia bacterium]